MKTRIILGLSFLLLLVSCGKYYGVKRFEIRQRLLVMDVKEERKLDWIVEPESYAHDASYDIRWSSSDPSVVDVDFRDGLAKAISVGTCTITARLEDKRATCEITVVQPFIPVEYASLNLKEIDLKKTDTQQLKVYFSPSDATDPTFTWESEDPKVASVDQTGLVTGVSAGVTKVSARCGEVSASCNVSVWERGEVNVKWVDLGLSVDWCETDLGAEKPEELGDYYAWGEKTPKTYFDWANYAHCNAYSRLIKYNSDSSYGYTDGKTQLELTDDAAYRVLGDDCRIPSSAQWVELLESCKWEEFTLDKRKGYKVSNKKDPNQWIFLPYGEAVSGVLPEELLYYEGEYWTSSRVTSSGLSPYAWTVLFSSSLVIRLEAERCFGMRIRPVRLKE